MKTRFFSLLLIIFLAAPLWANDEAESYALIRQAYNDHLFLFVEEKSLDYLSQSQYDQEGDRAQKVFQYLIGGLMERGAQIQALRYIKEFETRYEKGSVVWPSIQFYKAWALFDAYTDKGLAFPEEYTEINVSKVLDDVKHSLAPRERMMALYKQGQDFFFREYYHEAQKVFSELTKKYLSFRDYENALFYLGKCYFYLPAPDYNLAIKTFDELIAKRRRSQLLASYYFWKGACLYEKGRLDEAKSIFKDALQLDPDKETRVDLYYNLGWLDAAQGKLSSSLAYFEKLTDDDLADVGL
ncbi:MAG: tetratricopeptide repeat protein, partial [Planctomycetes bacterium]|nr:tetratricopeptide repeat protein [Planctomycetota bacterium]